jgi:hypothetical protein
MMLSAYRQCSIKWWDDGTGWDGELERIWKEAVEA